MAQDATEDLRLWQCASGPHIDEVRAGLLKDAYAVAWLLALGQEVDEIVDQLHLSRATVYRLIKTAQESHLLDMQPRVAIPRGAGARILLDEVKVTPLANDVRQCYRDRGEEELAPLEVYVTSDSGLPRSAEQGLEQREHAQVNRVARLGARLLTLRILEQGARTIGISWGYHCRRLARSLPGGVANRIPKSVAETIDIFPLVGSLAVREFAQVIIDVSANANALRAVENLSQFGVEPAQGGDEKGAVQSPVLLTQPCVIPVAAARTRDELRAIWRYVSLDHSVRAIFGETWACNRGEIAPPPTDSSTALLRRADTLITGVGPLDPEKSTAILIGAIDKDMAEEARQAGAVADLSGHFVCHARNAEACAAKLVDINRMVVAPELQDYIDTTRRARMTGRGLGTMLMAAGVMKAEAVEAIISHGAVNVLVCSEDLAMALIARLRG